MKVNCLRCLAQTSAQNSERYSPHLISLANRQTDRQFHRFTLMTVQMCTINDLPSGKLNQVEVIGSERIQFKLFSHASIIENNIPEFEDCQAKSESLVSACGMKASLAFVGSAIWPARNHQVSPLQRS